MTPGLVYRPIAAEAGSGLQSSASVAQSADQFTADLAFYNIIEHFNLD
jgi:hypothetical protein